MADIRALSGIIALAFVLGVAGLAACGGSAQPCGPTTCATCCTGDGVCVATVSAVACGGSGSVCVACSAGQACVDGLCSEPPSNPNKPNDPNGPSDQPDGGTNNEGISGGEKRIFVTGSLYTGNLKGAANAATGIQGADALCQRAANAANIGGTWKAWISGDGQHAIDRIEGNGPWVLMGTGQRVFNNRDNLSTRPLTQIDHNENGVKIESGTTVWTGTNSGGTEHHRHCSDWTESNSYGTSGRTYSMDSWTFLGETNCAISNRLYCLEQ